MKVLREKRAKAWEKPPKVCLDPPREAPEGFVSAEDGAPHHEIKMMSVNLGKEIEELEKSIPQVPC